MTAINHPMGSHARNLLAHLPNAHTSALTSQPDQPAQLPDRFIRRREVTAITSLSSSSITDLMNAGDFPRPYKLSERSTAWRLSDITAWMDSRQRAGGAA